VHGRRRTCPNGIPIGSSTTLAGNYPVTWPGQRANGAYCVVDTDNVNNTSAATPAIPVTVAN
jgi:hypothetical protein